MNLHSYFFIVIFVMAIAAAAHVIMYKRDAKVALGWFSVIVLSPLLGPILYFVFGLNRIKRKGSILRDKHPSGGTASAQTPAELQAQQKIASNCAQAHLSRFQKMMAKVGNQVSPLSLTEGNQVEMFCNGDQAYPQMLEAITKAKKRIFLASYIFNNDTLGRQFASALSEAQKRGVEVRVLVDSFGARYSRPTIIKLLRKSGIRTAKFLPVYFPWQVELANLRLHRKCLVVDNSVAFVGGMNIAEGNLVETLPKDPIQDVHFRVSGPVVSQCESVFIDDWLFATGETLIASPENKNPAIGPVSARCIADGPDSHAEKTHWMILAALAGAEKSVRIMTPYFFPDEAVLQALASASMRGVQIDIVLPKKNNLPWFQWAANTILWQVLGHGCRVWFSPGPFSHTKVFVVDGEWSLVGSSNWDRRSMRLNFELNMECFDKSLGESLDLFVLAKTQISHPISLEEMDSRSAAVRLRDGVARLFSPIL